MTEAATFARHSTSPITFIAPLPTSPVDVQTAAPTLGNTSIVSQSVTNNRCAPSCGGTREKWGHIKKFSAGALQIASDAAWDTLRPHPTHFATVVSISTSP